MDKPIDRRRLAKRDRIPARGRATRQQVNLLDVKLDKRTDPRLVGEGGRYQLAVELGAKGGVDVLQPFPNPKPVSLTEARIGPHLDVRDLEGERPRGVETSFLPEQAPPTHRLQAGGKDRDKGGTIFDTDDRYLFQDTAFPWRTTGKVRTAGGWGSGCTIGPRHVLTASHVVNWDSDGRGNVGWITFTPGYFDGRGPWGELAATEVIFWEEAPGTLTDQETAFDYVVLVMAERIGDVIGYPGYRTYNDDWNDGEFWQYIGYPGELASGERPAFQGDAVVSSQQDFSLNGNTGYVLGHFNEFTPGQSGGSAWGWWGEEPWPRVVGVGSTIGSTAVQSPTGSTTGDNEYGGGPALSSIISWARTNRP